MFFFLLLFGIKLQCCEKFIVRLVRLFYYKYWIDQFFITDKIYYSFSKSISFSKSFL